MLRIRLVPKNVIKQLNKNVLQDVKSNPSLHIARNQHSASSSGGSGLKVAAVLVGGTAASGGGVVAYAAYDADFRKSVEDTVPYADAAFDVILGPTETPKASGSAKPEEGLQAAKMKRDMERRAAEELARKEFAEKKELALAKKREAAALKAQEEAALKEKEEKSAEERQRQIFAQKQKEAKLKKEAEEREAAVLREKAAAAQKEKELKALKEKQQEEAKLAATLPAQPAPPPVHEKLNKELVGKLEEYHKKLSHSTNAAIDAVREATSLVKEHAAAVSLAVSSPLGSKSEWESVTGLAARRAEAMNKATVICEDVKNISQKLQTEIDAAKNNAKLAANTAINEAELVLLQHSSQLADIVANLSAEKAEAGSVVLVGDEMMKSRDLLMEEIKAIAPEFTLDDSVKMNTEQLQQLVLHAYHRLLQKRPTYHDSEGSSPHVNEALLQSELDKQKERLQQDAQDRLASAKEEFESELHTQLKRAASAWSEHEKELLITSEERLNRAWERKLQDSLFDEQTSFRAQIGQANARVKGITEGLKGRIKLERAAKRAQDLWVACVALQTAIKHGGQGTWEDKCKPLHKEVDAIKRAAGDADSLPVVVTSSLPDESLHRGVYTEDALKERFLRVSHVCRKVALLGDSGSSLWQRLMASVHSALRINVFVQPSTAELKDQEIDVHDLNNNDILDRVRYYLDCDNLEQAVRYGNLLQGEARHYASEWLSEARLHLEARQVATALIAHATTIGIQALLS